jgi:hypothetical protein
MFERADAPGPDLKRITVCKWAALEVGPVETTPLDSETYLG